MKNSQHEKKKPAVSAKNTISNTLFSQPFSDPFLATLEFLYANHSPSYKNVLPHYMQIKYWEVS